jgi:5-dehydro-4-deoxyglucarate dehydratase
MSLALDGLLYFPVTPFGSDGAVDTVALADHLESRLEYAPGAVFAACGTGEFHALTAAEAAEVTRRSVEVTAGRTPVIAGVGGPVATAIELARAAADHGADGLLILPPYLVSGPAVGTIAYVEAITAATHLPVIVYHRGTSTITPDAARTLARNPKVAGIKDGVGDVGAIQSIVRAVAEVRDDMQYFNGLLTAELTQGAYRGLGVPMYSSAAFAMHPEIALAYYRAYVEVDESARLALLDDFYRPLVALRDETPGFGVSLIKAGLRLRGDAVGSVRPPLVDPDERQTQILAGILDRADALTKIPA